MDKRIIATLSECMDQIIQLSNNNNSSNNSNNNVNSDEMELSHTNSNNVEKNISLLPKNLVIFIAATNKAENLDPVIRGRFANEIVIPVPDGNARTRILQHFCKQVNYDKENVCFHTLGHKSAGYVGSDLKSLMEQACLVAIKRIIKETGGERVLLSQLYNRNISSIFDLDSSVWNRNAGMKRSTSTLSLESGIDTMMPLNDTPIPSSTILTSSNCMLNMNDFLIAMKCKQQMNSLCFI